MNIIKLINDFKKNNSMLWVEANNIKLFVADEFHDNEAAIGIIKEHKLEIIDHLVANNIFSKEDFQQKTIFRTPGNKAPLSFAQQRLWFIEQFEQGSNAYHIPLVIELDEKTDVAGIKYALQQIVSRHDVLRSTIEYGDNEENGVQCIHDEPVKIEEVTITDDDDLRSMIEEDINQPFDLGTEYPVRIKFYTIRSAGTDTETPTVQTVLMINFHHIASDGWSLDIFDREWAAYYEAYTNNDTNFSLPPLDIQYKDYAAWQRNYLSGDVLEKQLSYWKDKLSGYQPLELPTDYARPAETDYSGARQIFTINKTTSERLRNIAQENGVTLYSVMLSSYSILLGKYSGQYDIVVGSPIANRHHRETEGLIGFFVNMQVNRTLLNRTQTFKELVQQVHQEQVQAQSYQDLPFEKLVEELGIERDPSRHPLFQVMFGIQDMGQPDKAIEEKKGNPVPTIEDVYEVEKFDISIYINDGAEELSAQFSYATSLFSKDSMDRFNSHYTYLLDQLAANPEQPYDQVSLLSTEEYDQIIHSWNDTGKEYPKQKIICDIFREQAEKTPTNIAVEFEGQTLTYKELDEKSNSLARHIRTAYKKRTGQELAAGTFIALYVEKSLEMVIAMFAVLKAGGAYVPMDTNHPRERIEYVLGDTGAELILCLEKTGGTSDEKLPADKIIHINLSKELYNKEDNTALSSYSGVTDIAYIIYTSGTTGQPKGVKVTHANLVNHVFAIGEALNVNERSVMLQYASLIFDASVWETFCALAFGGQVSIVPAAARQEGRMFCDYLAAAKVTVALLPPPLLSTMPYAQLPHLQTLMVGGEVCSTEVMDKWSYGRTLFNAYGPTECTVITTLHVYKPGDKNTVIGKPLHNSTAYILDGNLSPVPVGVIGELYIGGAGITNGYLNKEELTKERFITNPFPTNAETNTRLYKTGDLVRWTADGEIDYIGRNDDQVKIRGFRIELGEIAHALSQINGISQSCVLVKERKTATGVNKYLVGYYVPDKSNDALSQTSIISTLSQVLPEYMVPASLVEMESFPMTINGKLDKRALPDPGFSLPEEEYVAPANDTETTVCTIWQEALGVKRVGITDNFFRIGGNSILAIQVSHRMSKALACDVKVADIFRFRNIQVLLSNLSVNQIAADNVEWEVLID